MHFVIFTGGKIEKGKAVEDAIANSDNILAADYGAVSALQYNCYPKTVIGDLDSLDDKTKNILLEKHTQFIVSPAKKNESDTELALQFAIKNGATKITVLGGIEGNRIDHILTNISLLLFSHVPLRIINGFSICWAEKGPKEINISGEPGDLLSLIPFTLKVTGIKTLNLEYTLEDGILNFGHSRGVSNVFLKKDISVSFTNGTLILIHINHKELLESSKEENVF